MSPSNKFKTNIEWAFYYAKMGYSIMPVNAKKKSLLRSWKALQERLPTDEEIKSWWTKWPNAGIAIISGKISGIVVLDFDIKHGRTSQEFEMPETANAKSGSGGGHWFFKHPGFHVNNSDGTLFGKGIDLKADGGCIIVEPSINENGEYQWLRFLEDGIADMPEWLKEAVMKVKDEPKKWFSGKDGADEGSRNDTAASMAGKILSLCARELWDTAGWEDFKAWNEKNLPPLLLGELKNIWKSVKKYHIKKEKAFEGGASEENEMTLPDKLVKLVRENRDVVLFRSELDEPFICFPVDGHKEYWSCRDKKTKMWLGMQYFNHYGKSLNGDAINTALNTLQGFAMFKGQKFNLSNRVAFKDGNIFYSLSNDAWEAIHITSKGWSLVKDVPIIFRRQTHQNAQVIPVKGGDIMSIFKYINVKNEEHKLIFLVWLISCFIPDFPHVILYLFGPQGSAKSTSSKFIKKIIDPSKIDTFEVPKDPKELVQKLSHHWCLIFDNISFIPHYLSDMLCRAVTGSGFSKRELHSDDSDIIYSFKRCISINGVNLLALKPDLLERSILIELERVSKTERKNEQDLMRDFEVELPGLLGAIFDTVSKALSIRSSVKLKELPRMADFALWGYAISEALGYGGNKFIEYYLRNINLQHEEVINENPIASFIITLIEDYGRWEGNATALLKQMTFNEEDKKKFPKNPQTLSRQLNIIKTNLEEFGIIVEIIGGQKRKIIIYKKGENTAPTAKPLFK